MVFTVKVFGPDGCQREFKTKEIRVQQNIEKQQEDPPASIQKQKSKNNKPSSEGQKRLKGFITSLKKASSHTKCAYKIGPPAWIKKEITTNMMKSHLALPAAFRKAIGFQEPCMITPKTTLSSTKSWQARVLPYKNTSYHLGSGWNSFRRENEKVMSAPSAS